jgi:gamma-glutamyltranspeptidase/glutathione hydrolase
MVGEPMHLRPTKHRSVVRSVVGMVASAHPLASLAGAQVLRDGGNAVVAALALAARPCVVLPAQGGLGGDAFAVVYDARRRKYRAVHGSGVGPDGGTVDFYRERGLEVVPQRGPLSVAVPGAVAAMTAMHQRYSSMELERLWAPAAEAAAAGVALTSRNAADAIEHRDLLAADAEAGRTYLGDGVPSAGDVLRQPDLAQTLRRVAVDPTWFYTGEFAERALTVLRAGGAPFSGTEWSGQTCEVETPPSATFAGATVHTTGIPTPGYAVLQQARILDGVLAQCDWLGATAVHMLAQVARRALTDRVRAVGSTGDEWLNLLSERAIADARAEVLADAPPPVATGVKDGDTTSLVAVDSSGNAVSFIHSVAFSWGSGIMVPGTGVLLNNRAGRSFFLDSTHPNGVAPGRRPMHTLLAWIVAGPDGMPAFVGGTPGGDGQVQWNMQLLSHLLDHGLDVQEAVEAPRFTVFPGTDADTIGKPDELRCEDRLGRATLEELSRRGHSVKEVGAWGAGGGAQVIAIDRARGTLAGGSDPRQDGCALGI